MKLTKKLLALALAAMLFVTAFAITSNNSEAVFFEPTPEEIAMLDESNLVAQETFFYIVDESGELVCISEKEALARGNTASLHTNSSYTSTAYFYKSGTNYYVRMDATAKEKRWFTKSVMKILPKNNTQWITHNTPYETKPTKITDTMGFFYPNGAPTDVSVQVSVYFDLDADEPLGPIWGSVATKKATLDSPGN